MTCLDLRYGLRASPDFQLGISRHGQLLTRLRVKYSYLRVPYFLGFSSSWSKNRSRHRSPTFTGDFKPTSSRNEPLPIQIFHRIFKDLGQTRAVSIGWASLNPLANENWVAFGLRMALPKVPPMVNSAQFHYSLPI
jgi:hypothetical protein